MPISIRYGKNLKIAFELLKLLLNCQNRSIEKRKDCKMSISIWYGKNVKIAKCLSQLEIENAKIAKCLSQLGMELTSKFNLI